MFLSQHFEDERHRLERPDFGGGFALPPKREQAGVGADVDHGLRLRASARKTRIVSPS